jgi:hypothetical protein
MGEMCEASCYNICNEWEAKRIIISKLRFDLLDFLSAAEKECRVSKTGIVASEFSLLFYRVFIP